MPKPKISVIVPCHNDTQWLLPMLESIDAQTCRDRIQVILVDVRCDYDHCVKLVKLAEEHKCTLVYMNENRGFGAACNFGVTWAKGDVLYFINSDCWFEKDAIELLADRAYSQGVGLAFGTLCDYETVQVQSRPYSGFDIFGNSCGHDQRRVFSQVGFAMMSRTAFNVIGGFDPEHFMYGEEEDMSWRLWACGYSVEFVPEAVIHHRNSKGEYRASNFSRFLIARNCLLRLVKNADSILLVLLLPASLLILAEALIAGLLGGWKSFKSIGLDPFLSVWRLRKHAIERRKFPRIHGDFWMLRFFRFGFGRIDDVKKVLKLGLPTLK